MSWPSIKINRQLLKSVISSCLQDHLTSIELSDIKKAGVNSGLSNLSLCYFMQLSIIPAILLPGCKRFVR